MRIQMNGEVVFQDITVSSLTFILLSQGYGEKQYTAVNGSDLSTSSVVRDDSGNISVSYRTKEGGTGSVTLTENSDLNTYLNGRTTSDEGQDNSKLEDQLKDVKEQSTKLFAGIQRIAENQVNMFKRIFKGGEE